MLHFSLHNWHQEYLIHDLLIEIKKVNLELEVL